MTRTEHVNKTNGNTGAKLSEGILFKKFQREGQFIFLVGIPIKKILFFITKYDLYEQKTDERDWKQRKIGEKLFLQLD